MSLFPISTSENKKKRDKTLPTLLWEIWKDGRADKDKQAIKKKLLLPPPTTFSFFPNESGKNWLGGQKEEGLKNCIMCSPMWNGCCVYQGWGKNMLQRQGQIPAGIDKKTHFDLFQLNLLCASEPYLDSYSFSA